MSFAKARAVRRSRGGFTLAELMVAITVLVVSALSVTQALLQLNRRAAVVRVMNAAKAEALSRIQQVSQCAYNPKASPPVIPSLLTTGTTTQAIDLGSSLTNLGSIPGTATWTVTNTSTTTNILSIKCTISYKYLGKQLSYELFTYKSPD